MILGYRSDVRIATSKKGFDVIKKVVEDRLQQINQLDCNLLDCLDIKKENDEVCYFGWNNIKWYDGIKGYEEVDAILEGLDELEEKDISYRFARIGESYDDYEQFSHDGIDEVDLKSYVPYPSVSRYFDDEYLIFELNAKEKDLEVSL